MQAGRSNDAFREEHIAQKSGFSLLTSANRLRVHNIYTMIATTLRISESEDRVVIIACVLSTTSHNLFGEYARDASPLHEPYETKLVSLVSPGLEPKM